jgi:O-antigen/teichoic acid export membrane protein
MNRPLASVKQAARRLRRAESRDFAWGFASQGASSITNLGLSLLAGRLLGPSGLGSTFVGFSYYLLAIGFLRSLITDPLLAATASLDDDARRGPTRSALTMALLLAAIATTLLFVTWVMVPSNVGRGLILFVPWLVPALLQDFWRSVLFRDRRGAAGALNDTLWFAGMAVTLPVVLLVRTDWIVIANWGFGASVAAAAGFIQSRVMPAGTRTSARWWGMRAWKLGRWLAAETIVYMGASQLLVFMLAGILGTRSLGGLRAVGTLFGPLTLLAPALALPGLPALSRASAESAEQAVRLALSMGVLAIMLTGGYLAVAAASGDQLLEWVFGPSFIPFGALILPIGVGQILIAGTMGFALLLKAQARGRALLAARVVGSVASLVLVLFLAAGHGVAGAAWGMAMAGGLSSLAIVAYSVGGRVRPRTVPEEGTAQEFGPGRIVD